MKSVTAGDSIYFLIQYDDPTHSLRRSPFQKQADGSCKKLKDPNDKGGDDNPYYERRAVRQGGQAVLLQLRRERAVQAVLREMTK